jgi:hypothetical protein
MSMAKRIQNDSLLLDWETKKLFWDYLGCESITQKSTGKKEHYRRNIGRRRTLESTNQHIRQSLTGISWYGKQNLDQLERQFGNKIGCRSEPKETGFKT